MTQAPASPDTRPLFVAALAQVAPLIDSLIPADLDRATPCERWRVRDLLSHLLAVQDRIVHIAGGGLPAEVPAQVEGVADDQWSTAWAERLEPLRAVISNDAVLSRSWQHPAGTMPGAQALAIYASELAVHAWDLARAVGRDALLDPGVAGAVVGPIIGALPADPRGEQIGIPFGPVVEVSGDADPYARLVGWVGRDPEWTAA